MLAAGEHLSQFFTSRNSGKKPFIYIIGFTAKVHWLYIIEYIQFVGKQAADVIDMGGLLTELVPVGWWLVVRGAARCHCNYCIRS